MAESEVKGYLPDATLGNRLNGHGQATRRRAI